MEQFNEIQNDIFSVTPKLRPKAKQQKFVRDVSLVAAGNLRTCILVDHHFMLESRNTIQNIVSKLRETKKDTNNSSSTELSNSSYRNLMLLTITTHFGSFTSEFLFIIHAQNLLQRLDADISSSFNRLQFINVDSSLRKPEILNKKNQPKVFQVLTQVRDRLKQQIGNIEKCKSHGFPFCVDIDFQENPIDMPCVIGWLLGYPSIYCHGSLFSGKKGTAAETPPDNCLAMETLNLYKVVLNIPEEAPVEVSAFSIPQDINTSGRNDGIISNYVGQLSSNGKTDGISLEMTSTKLGSVLL
eukprot:gb/GECH01007552.1/.p1 GENE.gb/GECH01007552.1/~~gb/GECH01007552.1/.p1  ORF type:complete len:299 (+),score=53.82 gb/GECH01007552.1/:1-897(+)